MDIIPFKYTQAMLDKTVLDIKRFLNAFTLCSQLFYIAYLVYAMCTFSGLFAVNFILAIVSTCYLCIYLFTFIDCADTRAEKRSKRRLRQRAGHIDRIVKISGKTITLGVAVYSLYLTADNLNVTSILLTVAMFISWFVEIVLELIAYAFESRKDLFVAAMMRDVEFITKPANAVGNFINRLKGEEPVVYETPSDSKTRKLDKILSGWRERKARENAQKEARRNEKAREREESIK